MNDKTSFVRPQKKLAPGVSVVSTCRSGGVSENQYAAFNLALHCGDNKAHVLENRSLLERTLKLPNSPCWLKQIHGSDIIEADHPFNSTPTADGIYTRAQNTVCAVMTADCLPLVLCDKDGHQLMAIHAGWRGIAEGIVEKAVALFDCSPQAIRAWAGPTIGPNAFEVGPEVIAQLGGDENAYRLSNNGGGRHYADLAALVGARLSALGVVEYAYANLCTYAYPERFFSYRRDGQTGRMATLIWKDV